MGKINSRIPIAANRAPLTIADVLPELRMEENDQSDPVGRFRWRGSGGSYILQKALTANWATTQDLMTYDVTNTVWLFNALQSNAWYINLLAGVAATAQTNSRITIGGSTASVTGVRINTGDGTGSLVERLAILMGAASVDIDVNNAAFDFNGNATKGFASTRGNGTADFNIIANKLVTDATARRIALWVLDPATDTEYAVAQAVPKAATPLWTMLAPNYTPTTSEVDATNLTFTVNGSDQLIANYNKAGAMKTLAIGTVA